MHPAIAAANAIKLIQLTGQTINFEMVLTEGYRRFLKPGDVAVDLGAHSGEHLGQIAHLVGENGAVHAFEPIPHLATALRERFRTTPRVHIREAAVSRERGETDFVVAQSLAESGLRAHFFSRPDMPTKSIRVVVETLDNALAHLDRLAFIKMDIEGAEIDALSGATALLARHRPIISVEYGWAGYGFYGHERRSLFDFAGAHGYFCADLFGNLVEEEAVWNAVADFATWDFFLVPRELKAGWIAAFIPR
ncbi:FkbM family methyltransferase [Methylobacterium sp. WL12]|uniref:FkbM family methyltransferase n=1 Tax=Methylobacterium sp. WL12 TaxID=2603890 RepID=UPI0011C7882D|nr:FkbM family methyltransferase [Methylobacterium sp. WL12]TXM65580.1 FkbM family methyltransferase [Methylobacterium sp. WL12]